MILLFTYCSAVSQLSSPALFGGLFRGLIAHAIKASRIIDNSPERKLSSSSRFVINFQIVIVPWRKIIFIYARIFHWRNKICKNRVIYEITLYSNVINLIISQGVSCLYFKVNDDHNLQSSLC